MTIRLDATTQRIVSLVRAAPDGISSAAIAKEIGRSQNTVQQHLKIAHTAGLVSHTGYGRGCLWARNGDEERVALLALERLMHEAEAAGRLDQFYKHRREVERRKGTRLRGGRIDDGPLQRIVPADKAEPIKTRGVRSVWELGA